MTTDRMVWDGKYQTWVRVNRYGQRVPDEPEPTTEILRLFAPIRNHDAAEPGCITDTQFIQALRETPACDTLRILVDSEGGHVEATKNIIAAIKAHRHKKLVTVAVGKCFSAALAIFMEGDERLSTPDACFMAHNVHIAGNELHPSCVSDSEWYCDQIAARLPDIPRADVREWIHATSWIAAARAWKLGIVTNLTFDTQQRAAFDVTNCRQPGPVTDYVATRQFAAKYAASQKPPASKPPVVSQRKSVIHFGMMPTLHIEQHLERICAPQAAYESPANRAMRQEEVKRAVHILRAMNAINERQLEVVGQYM